MGIDPTQSPCLPFLKNCMANQYSCLPLVRKTFPGSILLFIASILLFSGLYSCKKKGDPAPKLTEEQRVTKLLSANAWKPPTTTGWVLVDGVDASELFVGFTITFTETGYTTTGTSPVWPATDTWKFLPGSTTEIIRGVDNLQVTIINVDDNTLKLTLFWDQETTTGGRKSSIRGKHEFNFSK